MASFTLEREVAAPPQTVFDVLTEHHLYASITPMRRSVLEREGEPAPNGVGAIRALTSVGPPLREEVVGYEPPTRFAYKVLSGMPVRDHVGTVELTPSGGGTRLVYAVVTTPYLPLLRAATPTLPLIGDLVVAVVRQAIKALIRGVSTESERRAADAAR